MQAETPRLADKSLVTQNVWTAHYFRSYDIYMTFQCQFIRYPGFVIKVHIFHIISLSIARKQKKYDRITDISKN